MGGFRCVFVCSLCHTLIDRIRFSSSPPPLLSNDADTNATRDHERTDSVLNHPRITGLPLLLLANKQDLPSSLSITQIRENYEEWWQLRNAEHAHRLGASLSPLLSRISSLLVEEFQSLHIEKLALGLTID